MGFRQAEHGKRSQRGSRSLSPQPSQQPTSRTIGASSSSGSVYDRQRPVPVASSRGPPRRRSPSDRRPSPPRYSRGATDSRHAVPESSRKPPRSTAPSMYRSRSGSMSMKRRRSSSPYDPTTYHEHEKSGMRSARRASRSPPPNRRRMALDLNIESSARGESDNGHARIGRWAFDRLPATTTTTESRRSRSSPPPVERMRRRRGSPSRGSISPERYERRRGPKETESRGRRHRNDWNYGGMRDGKPRRRSRSRSWGRSSALPTRSSSPPSSRYGGGDRRIEEWKSGRNLGRSTHERDDSRDRDGFARDQAYIHSEATPSHKPEPLRRDKYETGPQLRRNETKLAVAGRATPLESRKQDADTTREDASGREREPRPTASASVVVEDEKEATISRNSAKGAHGSRIIRDIYGNVVSGTLYGGTVNMNYFGEPIKLLEQLKPSLKADYRYYPEGNEMGLDRVCCTRGTRKPILRGITQWAISPSFDCATVFWLAGPAGTGKTTIANTICHELDSPTAGDNGSRTVVGGSFFCSRQFPETRSPVWIIRTIVYQLALKSKAFKAVLLECEGLETVDHGPKSQLMALLVEPWKKSAQGRLANNEPAYVIPIDALDELERERGSEFLRTLFTAVKDHQLSGLKFLVTSRLDHELVKEVESFRSKQVCRLEQVPVEETNADIKLFLEEHLGACATKGQILQLVSDAAGLFIYAATVVEYVNGRDHEEQKSLLGRLIATSPSPTHQVARSATAMLDNIYIQILEASLVDPRDRNDLNVFESNLAILHTFLCTIERTSVSAAVGILNGSRDENKVQMGDANGILRRLHAVLYINGGQVMSFHKSFPDFIFDKSRSQRFYCNQDQLHHRLAEGCFEVMNKQLHFNIANIPSSYQLDCDNATLASSIDTSISDVLRYACGSWTGHLTLTPREQANDVLNLLHDLLQLRFLFWIEAMNLLGWRGRCQGMLRDAQNWVAKNKKPVGWARELADAGAFAMYHNTSGAALSTPHLYISSLATFPRNSSLLQEWRHHFDGIPKFVNAPGAAGQALLSSFVTESGVRAVAVSPDGTTAAIGASSKIHIWDMSTGEEVKTLEGHSGTVNSVAFSPDGNQVVSSSHDASIRVWELSSGEEVKNFQGHTNWVTSVAVSIDGTQIVSGSDDRSIRVWDLSNGVELNMFKGQTSPVTSVAFSPDSNLIVSGSWDHSVRVWDLSSGEKLKNLRGHTDMVTSVAISPDGTQIVSGSMDNTVRVWDMLTGDKVKTLEGHKDRVHSVAFSPDGTQIASGSNDGSVRVWDPSTGEEVVTFNSHTSGVTSVVFSVDGTQIVSGSHDHSVRVWDLATEEKVKNFEGHTKVVSSVAFSPDGSQAVSGSYDQSVRVWDLATGVEVKTFHGHTKDVNSVDFSPNGTQVVSGSDDHSVRVWDIPSGKEVKSFEGHTNWVRSVAFSPGDTQVASGSDDKSVQVWDVLAGKEIKGFEGHTKTVQSVMFSPDGTQIVSGSRDTSVRVWDLSTMKEVKTFEGHTDWVRSVAFSLDGTQIVSGSDDQSLRVWDLATGTEVKNLFGHPTAVNSVAVSPDGTRIVSGSDDKTIRVWDMASGEEIKRFEGHTKAVTSVAFSRDGTMIISGSWDKSVRIWDCLAEQAQVWYIRQKSLEGNHTGWLLSPSGYLMFVPLLAHLPDDSNILTIPSTSVPKLNLSKAKLGDRWAECYTPRSL